MSNGRRLVKIALCALGMSVVGMIGLVALVAIFRNKLVTLDD